MNTCIIVFNVQITHLVKFVFKGLNLIKQLVAVNLNVRRVNIEIIPLANVKIVQKTVILVVIQILVIFVKTIIIEMMMRANAFKELYARKINTWIILRKNASHVSKTALFVMIKIAVMLARMIIF